MEPAKVLRVWRHESVTGGCLAHYLSRADVSRSPHLENACNRLRQRQKEPFTAKLWSAIHRLTAHWPARSGQSLQLRFVIASSWRRILGAPDRSNVRRDRKRDIKLLLLPIVLERSFHQNRGYNIIKSIA